MKKRFNLHCKLQGSICAEPVNNSINWLSVSRRLHGSVICSELLCSRVGAVNKRFNLHCKSQGSMFNDPVNNSIKWLPVSRRLHGSVICFTDAVNNSETRNTIKNGFLFQGVWGSGFLV